MEFYSKVAEAGLGTLTSRSIVKMQMDLGGVANDEIMSPEVVENCLVALQDHHFTTLELRNKAKEMHHQLLEIINKAAELGQSIALHINPEVLLLKEAEKLFALLLEHKITVIIDFPFVKADAENLKANELYQKTIMALKKLNALGYGRGEGLELNLFYKPDSAILPEAHAELEKYCKETLEKMWHVNFDKLFVAANYPVGYFAKAHLKDAETVNAYNELLEAAFDAEAVRALSCLNQIFVAADGSIYECEATAAIGLGVMSDVTDIKFFKHSLLSSRPIQVGSHCFACTAGCVK